MNAAPRDGEFAAPEFTESWQAQLFALTLALQDRGVFGGQEWSQALGAQIAASTAPDGSDYWDCWAAALADLLDALGLILATDLAATTRAWQDAAARSPHGRAIVLPAQ